MIDSIIRCDGPNCTSVRGVTNHWLMAKIHPFSGWWVFPWDEHCSEESDIKHLCGVQCAHRVLDQYLDSVREAKCAA